MSKASFTDALGELIAEFDHLPPQEIFEDLHKAAAEIGNNCDIATYPAPQHGWTCFHCGETFVHQIPAKRHFGATSSDKPACIINSEDRGLLKSLRVAERELREARAALAAKG